MTNFTPEFTTAQIARFEELRGFYSRDLHHCTKKEKARLLFLRWMWETGRLDASAQACSAAGRQTSTGSGEKADVDA